MITSRQIGLASVIACTIAFASFPAWTGSWIYDDWSMHSSAKMNDVADLFAVFERTSSDYLDASAAGPATYRPLSMATLIVGKLLSDAPLPHHLFSLALHLTCVALLGLIAFKLRGVYVAACVALVFGLHPLGVEAYGWINGRSDALACFGLALVALGLFATASTRDQLVLALLGSTVVAFSKETALVGLLGLTCAKLSTFSFAGARRDLRANFLVLPVLACWFVATGFVLARSLLVGGASAGPLSLFEAPGAWSALLRLTALASESVFVPSPRTMANLGYALAQPIGLTAAMALIPAVVIALLLRHSRRSLIILAFAVLSVVPCILLRHAFWHGLDRYLYVPLFMVCLAWITVQPQDGEEYRPPPFFAVPVLAVLASVLATSTWLTAETYRDTPKHMLSMIELRPTDPTGYLIGARWLWYAGQHSEARALLDHVPRVGSPAPIASTLATQLSEMGQTLEALAVVKDMEQRYPHDPYVLADVVSVQIAQTNLDPVLDAFARLAAYPRVCHASKRMLVDSREKFSSAVDRERIDWFLAGRPCR